MKIVINKCYGGFNLSPKVVELLKSRGITEGIWCIKRNDPVECVELLGEEADGDFAKLKVVEIPDDVAWNIRDYDGLETIEETHRSWS